MNARALHTTTQRSRRRTRSAAASVRAAVERSRRARLQRVRRRIVDRLDALYRLDRPAYRALVRTMRDVLTHERRRGR